MPIRLVLVDDHPIVLQGLQRLFESERDLHVVACCSTGDEGIQAVRQHRPDVLILDLRMKGRGGADVLRALGTGSDAPRTVILTAALRDDEVSELMNLGAYGIVLKESSSDALLECVRQVYQGKRWMDPETLARGLSGALPRPQGTGGGEAALTAREREVVRLVGQGMRNKEIAERLSISEGTVKIHLHNVYDKLGVDGRLELLLTAQQKGLL